MKLWLLNGYLFHKFSSNKLLTFSIKQVLKFSPCISSIKFVLSVYFIHKVCFYCCCYLSCEFIYLSAFWIIYLLIRWPIPKKMFSFFFNLLLYILKWNTCGGALYNTFEDHIFICSSTINFTFVNRFNNFTFMISISCFLPYHVL